MPSAVAPTAFVLGLLQIAAAAAQDWYWCEPAGAYYPYVARCPVPWRIVRPSDLGSQPNTATSSTPLSEPIPSPSATTPNNFPVLGDTLDDWCKGVQLASSLAICSDGELRALLLERQRAYDEAKARLSIEQQKALLADQNRWVKSYARACGLMPDAPPSMPLSPEIKNCMRQEGQARTTYLRAYAGQGTIFNLAATASTPSRSEPQQSEHQPQSSFGSEVKSTSTRPSTTPALTEENQAAPSIGGFGAAVLIPLSILFLIVLGISLIRRWLRIKHDNLIMAKLNKTIQDNISLHSRALLRKRFQTLRRDDYGNLIREPWQKEISYFIDNVLIPNIQDPEEHTAFFSKFRPFAIPLIETFIEDEARRVGDTITFGPNLSPVDYENYCAEQLRAAGWSAQTTKASGDQGSDVIAEKEGRRLVVQCKLYNHPVGNKAVQEVAAARAHELGDYAAVVTNVNYTPAAQELAKTNKVLLLHHTDLRNIDNILEHSP